MIFQCEACTLSACPHSLIGSTRQRSVDFFAEQTNFNRRTNEFTIVPCPKPIDNFHSMNDFISFFSWKDKLSPDNCMYKMINKYYKNKIKKERHVRKEFEIIKIPTEWSMAMKHVCMNSPKIYSFTRQHCCKFNRIR